MARHSSSGEVFYAAFDLGAFRHAAARYVKLLIRARWRCEPGFLDDADLALWRLADISDEQYPAWRLLEQAATALGVLNTDFLPRCGSGGVKETDGSTPEGRLIGTLAGLACIDGGGPYHNGALLEAARELREGKTVDWRALVQWDKLPQIRADLDELPRPQKSDVTPTKQQVSPDEPTNDPLPRNVFRRDGPDWQLRYDGDTLFLLPDSAGLAYIQHLLTHPNRQVNVVELEENLRSRQVPRPRPGNEAATDLHTDGSLDAGPVLDSVAMKQCREEFEFLQRELERAQKNNEIARAGELQDELRRLANEVASAFTPKGNKQKKLGNTRKRILDRVTKAISRAIEKIGEKDCRFRQHILCSLKTGFTCVYSPEHPTEWDK